MSSLVVEVPEIAAASVRTCASWILKDLHGDHAAELHDFEAVAYSLPLAFGGTEEERLQVWVTGVFASAELEISTSWQPGQHRAVKTFNPYRDKALALAAIATVIEGEKQSFTQHHGH